MRLTISISGGGALGIGPLHFMRRLEKDTGVRLADVGAAFSGTSTGSIIAAGLCHGMSAEDIYNLYRSNLPSIFSKVLIKNVVNDYHLYDNSYLKKLLQKTFKRKMYEFEKPIYIPATFMNGDSVEKVWDRGDGMTDQWFAILSSCSAPTYFNPISRIKNGQKEVYCDGGLWANDPIMVLESGLNKYKEFKDDYKILTFNTAMRHTNIAFERGSLLGWGKYIMEEWVARTGRSGYFQACANIGEKNVCRLAPRIGKAFAMDNLKILDQICEIWDKYYDEDDNGKKACEFVMSTTKTAKNK